MAAVHSRRMREAENMFLQTFKAFYKKENTMEDARTSTP